MARTKQLAKLSTGEGIPRAALASKAARRTIQKKGRSDFASFRDWVAAWKKYQADLLECEKNYQKQLKDPVRGRGDIAKVWTVISDDENKFFVEYGLKRTKVRMDQERFE